MTSFTTQLGGYFKQFVGEVVGNPALHEKGKREVVGAPESETVETSPLSDADAALLGTPPPGGSASPPPAASRRQTTAEAFGADFDRGSGQDAPRKEKPMTVYTQLLPEIESGSGPYVKVSSDDAVLYVPITEGDPFEHAREAVLKMAEHLTAKPEKAPNTTVSNAGDDRGNAHSPDNPDDLEDELEIGLEDSFPASDPPAATTSEIRPKTHKS
tara:strand:+ start:7617 stop:8258 length:642 start_codon:yes stop_codon:yes gene_type:complete